MPEVRIAGRIFEVSEGTRLRDVFHMANVSAIPFPCGGRGTCGKCKVQVMGACSPISPDEAKYLNGQERQENIRLACYAAVMGDLQINLPEEERLDIQETGILPQWSRKTPYPGWAVAVDLGTTTIASSLCRAGIVHETASLPNPQSKFGADVMTRIEKSLTGLRDAMQHAVCETVSALITQLLHRRGLLPEDLPRIAVTGNTAMLYLLTGEDAGCLSHAPFHATQLFGLEQSASCVFPDFPHALLYLCPAASAFVGGDMICAALASEMTDKEDTVLLADIGTNGEMALWSDGRLLCCSTAAGPVFEGAGIQFGMRGGAGAIDHVRVENGELIPHIIGNIPAKGICGSGVIDTVAALLDTGHLDETGSLETKDAYSGIPAVKLTSSVWITQQDIRKVQLAKSAVSAGIRTLLAFAGKQPEEVQTLFVAGGFGSHIDSLRAAAIDLIPKELAEKLITIGNAALSGAVLTVSDQNWQKKAELIAKNARTIDLAANPVFAEFYVDGMLF